MNQLLLKCKVCGKIFSSGIAMGPGSSATFINNKSQCRYCGSIENIPDGKFRSTVEGFIKVLEDNPDPLKKAKELLEALQKSKTVDDLSAIKRSSSFFKLKKWIPNSPEKIAAYLAIIYTLIQLWTKTPNISIEYSTFVNQYNKIVEIQIENKFTTDNN
jgi:hypothetical protein